LNSLNAGLNLEQEEMEMRLDIMIQDLPNQVGEEFSPFKLARYMGIKITFNIDLDNVLGFYPTY
jgi:hypothetical protein